MCCRDSSYQKLPHNVKLICRPHWAVEYNYGKAFFCDSFQFHPFNFFSVNVVMKGSHGYISITEWPLMIVSITKQSKSFLNWSDPGWWWTGPVCVYWHNVCPQTQNYNVCLQTHIVSIDTDTELNPSVSLCSSTWWCASSTSCTPCCGSSGLRATGRICWGSSSG